LNLKLGIDTQEKNDDDDITQVSGIFDSQDPTEEKSDDEGNDSGYHTTTSEEVVTSQVATTSTSPLSSEAAPEEQDKKHTFDSKFFAIRITGGQEHVVANILQNKITAKQIGIYSILVLDNFKGYIVVEAPDSNIAYQALVGVRHVRGQIRGELPFKDIEGYLVKKPVVSDLNIDDTVEVIAGPFKAMKAKIIRVDYEKQEATVVLLDSPYQIPVTVDANYLKRSLR
jgi:transcription termination/antitermination protein NusG